MSCGERSPAPARRALGLGAIGPPAGDSTRARGQGTGGAVAVEVTGLPEGGGLRPTSRRARAQQPCLQAITTQLDGDISSSSNHPAALTRSPRGPPLERVLTARPGCGRPRRRLAEAEHVGPVEQGRGRADSQHVLHEEARGAQAALRVGGRLEERWVISMRSPVPATARCGRRRCRRRGWWQKPIVDGSRSPVTPSRGRRRHSPSGRGPGPGRSLAHLQRRARGASTLWRWCASMISMS